MFYFPSFLPAFKRLVPLAPAGIVGHVPLIAGRYCAEGLPPLFSPLLDPELLELTLASVISVEPLDPEVPLEPELPLDADPPLDPEPPFEPELPLPEPLDPELLPDPELFEELLEPLPPELPPKAPGSVDDDPPQLATSAKLVSPTPKTSDQRMASSVAAPKNSVRQRRPRVKARL